MKKVVLFMVFSICCCAQSFYIELTKPNGQTISTNTDQENRTTNYHEIHNFLSNEADLSYGRYANSKRFRALVELVAGDTYSAFIHPEWEIVCKHVEVNNYGARALDGVTLCPLKFNNKNLDVFLRSNNANNFEHEARSTFKIDNQPFIGKDLFVLSRSLHNAKGGIITNGGLWPSFISVARLNAATLDNVVTAPFIRDAKVLVRTYGGDSGGLVFTSTGASTGSVTEQFKLFGIMHGPGVNNAVITWLGHPEVYSWIKNTVNAGRITQGRISQRMPDNPQDYNTGIYYQANETEIDPLWAVACLKDRDIQSQKVLSNAAHSDNHILLSRDLPGYSLYLCEYNALHYMAVIRSRDAANPTYIGPYALDEMLNAKIDKCILKNSLKKRNLLGDSYQLIDPQWALVFLADAANQYAEMQSSVEHRNIQKIVANGLSALYLVQLNDAETDKSILQRSRDPRHPTMLGSFVLDQNINAIIDKQILSISLRDQ
jgi:hypothetical protein